MTVTATIPADGTAFNILSRKLMCIYHDFVVQVQVCNMSRCTFLCAKQTAGEVLPILLERGAGLRVDGGRRPSELGFPVQPNQENKGHNGHYQNKNEQDL
jgi:hypothetical protein